MEATEPNRPRATPLKYLGALVALMAASAWLAAGDARHRAEDEATGLPTGLGDRSYHRAGTARLDGDELTTPLAFFGGRKLYPRTRVTSSYADALVERVGPTDDGALSVYRPSLPEARAKLAPDSFLLKAGDDPESPGRSLYREVGEQKYSPDEEGASGR